MKYCARCLYPENHPLNITFDSKGVCSGCRVHEEKDALDWSIREKKLRHILDSYRNQDQSNFDCIIPVSGARDSWFIVHTIKNVYGLNPLLVCYNKQYNTAVGIRNLAYLKTVFNCDAMMKTISPKTAKKLTRYTLQKMGSMYWHCLAGQTVFPVQVAVRFKIPLIIWGVHQGCDQVGMFSHLDEVEMTRKYRKEHDLMGFEAEDLIDEAAGITHDDIKAFLYPHDKDIEAVGVRGIYLSNYIRWDTKKQHESMIDQFGYETLPQQRTFDTYNDVDCHHYSGLHDYIKFLKHGYGKVTDHACREIRLKRLTREKGIGLVKQYQDRKPKDLNLFLDWADINEKQFFSWIDKHRNNSAWSRDGDGNWFLKDSITAHEKDPGVESARLENNDTCEFTVTKPKADDPEGSDYILVAKGYVDNLSLF